MVSTRGQSRREQATLEDVIRQSAKLQKKTKPGRITKIKLLCKSTVIQITKNVVETSIQEVASPPKVAKRPALRHPSRRLRIKLQNIQYSRLPAWIQRLDWTNVEFEKRTATWSGKYLAPPRRTYNNKYHFSFGHNPFLHTGFQGPRAEQQWHVYELMKKDLKENFNKDCFLDQPDASTNEAQSGPMHMTDGVTIDNLVKVILSISTENSLAIRQHAQLCSKFTYTVDGKEVKGSVPNYHKMRVCPLTELEKALNIAGLTAIRAKAFKAILKEVHEQNVSRLEAWEVVHDGNFTNVADFVPGLLSMDYLKGDGLTKQQRFDMLVQFDQIAVKTGCCLLAFNLKIPVFVVDTHVHQMTRNLQWIPEDCSDADKACNFLDTIMPDQLKFGLHQAFWHHRINCARCMPRANPNSLAYQQRMCPLEDLIKRDLPPMSRGTVRTNKDTKPSKSTQAADKKEPKIKEEKKTSGSVTFLNIHHKVAAEKGYALRKVDIDDNFGDGSRQNKDATASYYWGLKEFTHANDVVELEDALKAVGITVEQYEARFVKKQRAPRATGTVALRRPRKKVVKKKKEVAQVAEVDVDADIDMLDIDEPWDAGDSDSEYDPDNDDF